MVANTKQQELIDNTEGIIVVDAGAGTGKTSTITKRYQHLLEYAYPHNILLLTFTDNAAQHMKEKVVNAAGDSVKEVAEAPISTFHSFCNSFLKRHGFRAPSYLGFEEHLNSYYSLFDNDIIEHQLFSRFYARFQRQHFESFAPIFKILEHRSGTVLNLIKKLSSKGIFPTREGWFLNGRSLLEGHFERYREIFEAKNACPVGKNGQPLTSELFSAFRSKNRESTFLDAPSFEEMFADKKLADDLGYRAFHEDRELLFSFVHELYWSYIQYCLRMNRINFDFLIMFAFVLLCEDDELRRRSAFEYVMVDEFQDTNEIQFMLVMLLMKQDNLCAVGDWKQGIYGFRYASIENILSFEQRMQGFKETLNQDKVRIEYPVSVTSIGFDKSYRSAQSILDFSERALTTRATRYEQLYPERIQPYITSLSSGLPAQQEEYSNIAFLRAQSEEDEYRAILSRIQSMVGRVPLLFYDENNEPYTRLTQYRDIAVLSRTRTFGLELQNKGLRYNIPINYDGGIELFKSEPAILLLAWLRLILRQDNRSAWIPILEKEGYTYPQIVGILEGGHYPRGLLQKRTALCREKRDIHVLVERILGFYGFNCPVSQALVSNLESLFSSTLISVVDLINYIEENIYQAKTYTIDINASSDAVSVQTIHGAKGLEYPVVFLVDCNERHFPSQVPNTSVIDYHNVLGLRLKKTYGRKNGYDYIFPSWQSNLLFSGLHNDYDEERRLLYTAITRARHHIVITANARASMFFDELSADHEVEEDPPLQVRVHEPQRAPESVTFGPVAPRSRRRVRAVHDLIGGDDNEYGRRVHWAAWQLAHGYEPALDDEVVGKLRHFIDGLRTEGARLSPEHHCSLPLQDMALRGTVDLMAEFPDRVELIELKTDSQEQDELYARQMSCYYHAVRRAQQKPVRLKLYYVALDRVKRLEPIPLEQLRERLLQDAA